MLLRLLFLVAVMVGVFKLVVHFSWPESFAKTPELKEAFAQSSMPAQLKELSVDYFTVECGSWSKKTAMTIYFVKEEGRKPLSATSSRACENSGTLFAWSADGAFEAKENYKPELVFNEVHAFLEQLKVQKNAGNRFNAELAKHLEQRYAKLAQAHDASSVFFSCSTKGSPYKVVYSINGNRRSVTKELTTTCADAHQNFTVDTIRSEVADSKDVALTVHEYNAVDPKVAIAAYGEFLGAGPLRLSF